MTSPFLPGVILLHQPNRWIKENLFSAWISFLDEFFPNIQFVMTVPGGKRNMVPEGLLQKQLPLPSLQKQPVCRPVANDTVDVLLIDVDSRMPNVALMKLSRYFKRQRRKVTLGRGVSLVPSARGIYAGCIFSLSPSARKIQALQDFYGDSPQWGGSGIDI